MFSDKNYFDAQEFSVDIITRGGVEYLMNLLRENDGGSSRKFKGDLQDVNRIKFH